MISKENLELVRKIIENNYHALLVNILGNSVLSPDELEALEAAGIDTSDQSSLISLIYYQNVLYEATDKKAPATIAAAKEAQAVKPETKANIQAEEHLNENAAAAIRKLKSDVQQNFEGLLREANILERNADMAGDAISDVLQESHVAKIKQRLREASGDAARNFDRIAVTETSNAIGMGSVDRIVGMAGEKPLDEIYVYRISVNDAATCLAEDELVMKNDGSLVRVGDIRCGDVLRSARRKDNRNLKSINQNKVIRVTPQVKPVYEYKLNDGRVLRCTDDHPVLVKFLVNNRDYLLFLPIGDLEKSHIPYTICDYNNLTTGDRTFIHRVPAFVKNLGYVDFLDFWHDYKEFLHMSVNAGCILQDIAGKNLDVPDRIFIYQLLRLTGCDVDNVRFKHPWSSGNHYNKRYTDGITQQISDVIQKALPTLQENLDIGFKKLSRLIGLPFESHAFKTLLKKQQPEMYAEIKQKSKQRANSKMLQNPVNIENIRVRTRKMLAERVRKPSKPQNILYESLLKHFPSACVEASLLERMHVDILIDYIVIEYDGSGHNLFGRNNAKKDYGRDVLLKAAGYAVIRIKAPNDNQPDMSKLLDLIQNIKPGNYEELKL